MKKILLSAIVLAATTAGTARTLTPAEALQRVASSPSPLKVHALKPLASATPVHTALTATGEAAVYLFDCNAPGSHGYMLVSADDVAEPLLGYSDEAMAPGAAMPEQMQWWLGQYAAEIEAAKEQGARPLAARAAGSTSLGAPISPLCTTLWNQDAPYNQLCPKVNGTATMTGCMATALAQVMKYHNWPETGNGTSVTYTDGNGTQRYCSFSGALNWSRMLDSYAGTSTSAEKLAVALLMKWCGFAVHMTYDTQASSASDNYVVPALTEYFDYDKGARLCQRENYGLADWQEMIYDNLVECGPVLYCGSSHLGGHAFVCDGYSTDGFFHFNWGWGGSYDGYFRLTALNPEGQGIGGFAGGYNLAQTAVLGIQKPTGVEPAKSVQLTQVYMPEGDVTPAGLLTMTGYWSNYNGYTISYELGLKAEPVNGTSGAVRYITAPYGNLTLPNGSGYQSLQYYVNTLPNGTWRLSVVTRPAGETSNDHWIPTLHPINQPNFITLTRDGTSYSVQNPVQANLKVTSAELLSGLYNGCITKIRFTVTNPNDVEVAQVIEPILAKGSSVVAEAGGECIDLMPGETETREVTFIFSYFNGFEQNKDFDFLLFDPYSDMELYNLGTMQVKAYPGTPTLVADSFTLQGGTVGVNASNLKFDATVTCQKGYVANTLTVLITGQGGGSVLAMAQSDVLFMNAGDVADARFSLDFSTAEIGKTYTAFLCFEDILGRQQLKWLDFTVSTTGIEAVAADGADAIEIGFDRGEAVATVTSAAGALQLAFTSVSGAAMNVPVEMSADGRAATADLSAAPRGIVILTARDAAGNVRSVKIVR